MFKIIATLFKKESYTVSIKENEEDKFGLLNVNLNDEIVNFKGPILRQWAGKNEMAIDEFIKMERMSMGEFLALDNVDTASAAEKLAYIAKYGLFQLLDEKRRAFRCFSDIRIVEGERDIDSSSHMVVCDKRTNEWQVLLSAATFMPPSHYIMSFVLARMEKIVPVRLLFFNRELFFKVSVAELMRMDEEALSVLNMEEVAKFRAYLMEKREFKSVLEKCGFGKMRAV